MSAVAIPDRPRRFHFDWVLPMLVRPRATFARLVEQANDAWLTPLLVLTLAESARVLAQGSVRQKLAESGQVVLPPDFQYWTPGMQAQFMEAQQATSSPVFLYVFPALLAVIGVWLGWVLLAGLLHLILTMLGGRSATREALNVVAWAGLPLAIRALIRAGYALSTQSLIASPGLSGFAPLDAADAVLLGRELLALVDAFVIWQIVLLMLGGRRAANLSGGKVAAGVLIAMLIVLTLQAVPAFAAAQLDGLEMIRPFF